MDEAIEAGAARVVLGTAAYSDIDFLDTVIAKHDLPNCILPDAIADPYEMAKARLETLDEIGLAYLWSEMKETAQRSRDEVYDPWQR